MEIDIDKVLPKRLADMIAPKNTPQQEDETPPAPPPTDMDKINAGEKVSAPMFSDIFKETGDSTLKSATKFTDYITVEENKQKAIKTVIAVALILLFIGVVYIGYLSSRPAEPKPATVATTQTTMPSDTQWEKGTIENPVSKAAPNQTPPTASQVRADIAETTITFSNGYVLTLKNAKTASGQEACTVTQPTDFCYSGTIAAGENLHFT